MGKHSTLLTCTWAKRSARSAAPAAPQGHAPAERVRLSHQGRHCAVFALRLERRKHLSAQEPQTARLQGTDTLALSRRASNPEAQPHRYITSCSLPRPGTPSLASSDPEVRQAGCAGQSRGRGAREEWQVAPGHGVRESLPSLLRRRPRARGARWPSPMIQKPRAALLPPQDVGDGVETLMVSCGAEAGAARPGEGLLGAAKGRRPSRKPLRAPDEAGETECVSGSERGEGRGVAAHPSGPTSRGLAAASMSGRDCPGPEECSRATVGSGWRGGRTPGRYSGRHEARERAQAEERLALSQGGPGGSRGGFPLLGQGSLDASVPRLRPRSGCRGPAAGPPLVEAEAGLRRSLGKIRGSSRRRGLEAGEARHCSGGAGRPRGLGGPAGGARRVGGGGTFSRDLGSGLLPSGRWMDFFFLFSGGSSLHLWQCAYLFLFLGPPVLGSSSEFRIKIFKGE